MSKIDRNRGCVIRISPLGYRVVMYNDTPGVYFDEKAARVSDKIAEQAGFSVVDDRKSLAKQKLRTNYEKQIGAKFAAMEQRMDDLLENNSDLISILEVKEIHPGSWAIMADEEPVSETNLTYEEAVTLYTGLVGENYVAPGDEQPEQTNPFMDMTPKEIRALLKDAEVDVPVGLRMPKLAIFAFENCSLEDVDGGSEEAETDPDSEKDSSDLL